MAIDKNLDIAWSKLVKLRAGNQCQFCGLGDETLASHHIFGRANKSVRWDVENGVALCYIHHVSSSVFSAHGTPDKFDEWINGIKGVAFMGRLTRRKNSLGKFSPFEKEILLDELNKEIEKYES